MTWTKVDLDTLRFNPFTEIRTNWLLISAVKDGRVNTMTAGWGGVGVLWNKNVVTVYIRPQRYTKEFVDASDTFTVTMFDGHKPALRLLGSESGRDGDKIAKAGFHTDILDGVPTFTEGKMMFVCRKLYHGELTKENFVDKGVMQKTYPNKDFHHVYIGEIVSVYENR